MRTKRSFVLVAALMAVLALTVAGCAAKTPTMSASGSKDPAAGGMQSGNGGMTQMAKTTPEPGVATCADCGGKGMAPVTKGEAISANGKQVVTIKTDTGYYQPNDITVKAGAPVTVMFTGKASGCLAKPTFKSLNKSADMTAGKATIDLGALAPGTYKFTCAMGMSEGQIVAK